MSKAKRKMIAELKLEDDRIVTLERRVNELSDMLIKCYMQMRVEGAYIKDLLLGDKPYFTEENKKKLAVLTAERIVKTGTDIQNRYWDLRTTI